MLIGYSTTLTTLDSVRSPGLLNVLALKRQIKICHPTWRLNIINNSIILFIRRAISVTSSVKEKVELVEEILMFFLEKYTLSTNSLHDGIRSMSLCPYISYILACPRF